MAFKVDSTSIVKNSKQFELRDSTQLETNPIIFQAEKEQKVGDTVNINLKNNSEEKLENEGKKSNTKKWLIAAGIAAGAIAIGVAAYFITKKPPVKAAENLSNTIAGDSIEQLSRLDDFNVFKDLKMCKNLTDAEKQEVFKIITNRDSKNVFLATLSGDKPMTILSCDRYFDDLGGNNLHLLKKLDLGDNIEIFTSVSRDSKQHRFWSSFFVNKSKVFDVIEKNREIYTTRLNLPKNATTQEIYTKFFNSVVDNNNIVMHDLLGMSLGYPRMDSMFFQLEYEGNLISKRNFRDFPDLLTNFFKSEKSPYKNLSSETLNSIEEALIKFKKRDGLASAFVKKDYSDDLYTFVNYTQNADEISRVKASTDRFMQRFYPTAQV